jgi:Tol biopolymer transport system component
LALASDGSTLATMVRTATNDDIQLVDLTTGRLNRFSFGVSEDESPVWSPNGEQVAYSAAAAGEKRNVFVKTVATGVERLVYTGKRHLHLTSWSPDGQWIAFTEFTPGSTDIWLLNVKDASKVVPIANTSAREANAAFSPDGKWLAYVSTDESGRSQVYVVSFPDLGAKQQVSREGAAYVRWSTTGQELFFVGSEPQRLFKAIRAVDSRAIAWDVTTMFETLGVQDFVPALDGRSFYLVTLNADNMAREIGVIQNWFDEVLPGSRSPEH